MTREISNLGNDNDLCLYEWRKGRLSLMEKINKIII